MSMYEKYEEILCYICADQEPGKKMAQKLMYLMERKGVALGLNYSIHFYGPYSPTLDNAFQDMEAQNLIKITIDGLTHKISPTNSKDVPAALTPEERSLVLEVLKQFKGKTASELEALTTIDYVAHTLLNSAGDKEAVISNVIKIKGKKFSKEYLDHEYDLLRKYKYVE